MWGSKILMRFPPSTWGWGRERGCRGREVEDGPQTGGDDASRSGAFGGEVAQHAGEFGVAAGSLAEPVEGFDGYLGEEALEDGVPPAVRVEVGRTVRADGRGDQPGVVGAQGVLDEREGGGAEVEPVQGEEDGAAFGGGALFVEPGDGGQRRAGLDEQQRAYGVGVLESAVPSRRGEAQLPGRVAAVGAGVLRGVRGLGERFVEPGPGRSGEPVVEFLEAAQHGVAPSVVPVARRRKSMELLASSGPAWECRGSSTTVRLVASGGGERFEHRWEVDLAVTERQVLVDAASHVLDLHMAQPGGCFLHAVDG